MELVIRSPTGTIATYSGKTKDIKAIINNLTLGTSPDDYVLLAPESNELELYFMKGSVKIENHKNNHNNKD